MASNTERLFNAIVILGASLIAGCSGGSGDAKPAPQPGPPNDAGDPNFVVNGDASVSDAGWTGW